MIPVLSATPVSSQIKAAMVLRTGSLKLFHRAAGEWTILSSCSNIGLPDRTAGVHEYWIVDPAKNFVIVYNFDTSDSGQYTFADTIKAGIYEDLYIDFSKINL